MRRVARLLSEGVPGSRILLLSFTRTAAHDLTSKLAELEVEGAEAVKASTLHGYCFGLLQRDSVLAITRRTTRMLLPHEADLMLRDLEGDFGDLKERRAKLEAFQAGWLRRLSDHPSAAALPEERLFENRVINWLKHHRAMLIGEVVPIAYNYLNNNPEAPDLDAFDHVIVDEYQDLNALEQHLLDLLVSRNGSLCVAGDDDQSIYGFRHANRTGILDYQGREEVEPHAISVCGRCPRVVLAMANSLISHASEREKPELVCRNPGEDGDVAIIQWEDLDSEIEGTIASIITDVQSGRFDPGDILVLTHRKFIGERIRRGLQENRVPAKSYFREEGLGTSDAQEALALFRLLLSNDPVALRVILSLDDKDGRAAAYRRLTKFAAEERQSEREVLERLRNGEKLKVQISALVSRYEHAVNRLQQLNGDNLAELVDALFPEHTENLLDLRELLLEMLPDSDDAKDLLERLVASLTQMDIPQEPAFVRIMSLHKSKGLTSPSVYVAGLMDGIVPTLPGRLTEEQQAAAIEEQRRLLYVAITRSSRQLVLSSSLSIDLAVARSLGVVVDKKSIRRRGEGFFSAKSVASPYLAELGPEAPRPLRGVEWLQSR